MCRGVKGKAYVLQCDSGTGGRSELTDQRTLNDEVNTIAAQLIMMSAEQEARLAR